MIEDYLFVYHCMQTLIEKYYFRLTPKAVRKCHERSETYFQVALCGNPLTYFPLNGPLGSQLTEGIWFNITHFYEPSGALWYILSLAFWRVLLHLIPIRENKAAWIIVIACGISLLSGFIPLGRELSFQRTFAFFPYFLLGYYAKRLDGYVKLKAFNVRYAWGIASLYAIIIFAIGHFPLSMLVQFFHYSELGNPIIGLGMRMASYVWMLPLTLAILRLFANVSVFYTQGKDTLFYYIYHMYAIMGMRIALLPIMGGNLLRIVLASALIILLLYGMSKIKILYKPLGFIKVK